MARVVGPRARDGEPSPSRSGPSILEWRTNVDPARSSTPRQEPGAPGRGDPSSCPSAAAARGDADRRPQRGRGRGLSHRTGGMSARGRITVDTGVFGANQVRYGAMRRGWGEARMLKLDERIAQAEVVHSGPELGVHIRAATGALRTARSPAPSTPPQRRPLDRGHRHPSGNPARVERRHFQSGTPACIRDRNESMNTFPACPPWLTPAANGTAPRLRLEWAVRDLNP